MTPELVLFLVVFAMPGTAMVQSWDYFGNRRERTTWSLIGWGIITSFTVYSVVQWLNLFDLTALVSNGSVSAANLLKTTSMSFFAGSTVLGAASAGVASRVFHSSKVQDRVSRHLGTTFHESVWVNVVDRALNCWVRIEATDGRVWEGYVDRISTKPEGGFVLLAEPTVWVDGKNFSLQTKFAALPLKNVETLLLDCIEEDSSDNDDNKEDRDGTARRRERLNESPEEPSPEEPPTPKAEEVTPVPGVNEPTPSGTTPGHKPR